MEKSVNKIMLVSFVVGAFLAGYLASVIIQLLTESSGTMARAFSSQGLVHGIPIGVGVGLFTYLLASSKTRTWATEVIMEVSKVVWPSKKDTYALTVVVTIIVMLSGLVLFVFDQMSLFAVKQLLSINWFNLF